MLNSNKVWIKQTKNYKYPSDSYDPSELYPEYIFSTYNRAEENEVYNDFRSLMYEMGLDYENYGTQHWNPLKDIVEPGDMVTIKPNLVRHYNGIKKYSVESLITNGSLIHAVVDYVYIALKGKGKIIIGDAALQGCDFSKVVEQTKLAQLKEKYKREKNFDIEVIDFRKLVSLKDRTGQISAIEELAGDPRGYTEVDLKNDSVLSEISEQYEQFRVTNYIVDLMKQHHTDVKHEYIIPNSILQADVVINLPKPKSHRKAGITASLKNLVGINGHKDWLPHHRKGSTFEKGDEYMYPNIFKKMFTYFQEKVDYYGIKNKIILRNLFNIIKRGNGVLAWIFNKDTFSEGSWWGNDTIWRTVCDLNRLLIYADKTGVLKDTVQRKLITFCDMIISGENEGPLEATPKDTGVLVGGYNPLVMDTAIATIMGFDYKKIPNIYKAYDIEKYPISNVKLNDINIISNNKKWCGGVNKIKYKDTMKYNPTKGWLGHIELER